MRLARNLLLAATAALAAMAFMATAAFGQSIEVDDELNGGHCDDVIELANHDVTGGCEVHATSEDLAVTYAHTGTSEVVTSQCENEFTAYINEEGTGYIPVDDTSIHTNPVAGCVITPCDEAEPPEVGPHDELEWPISSLFEFGGGNEGMVITFCIRPFNTAEGVGNTPCTIVVDILQSPEHVLEFSANEEPCFETPARELSGHWVTEDADSGNETNIELEHIHYPTDPLE